MNDSVSNTSLAMWCCLIIGTIHLSSDQHWLAIMFFFGALLFLGLDMLGSYLNYRRRKLQMQAMRELLAQMAERAEREVKNADR